MIDQNIINILTISFLMIISFLLVLSICSENFNNIPPPGIDDSKFVRTVPTIKEQETWNNKFMKNYDKFVKETENEEPFMWNSNNSLESMKLVPCLADNSENQRMTCFSAPAWWYPYDKYDPNKFREIYYGDYFNPIYNFLGNAQEMYWDFRTVRNS